MVSQPDAGGDLDNRTRNLTGGEAVQRGAVIIETDDLHLARLARGARAGEDGRAVVAVKAHHAFREVGMFGEGVLRIFLGHVGLGVIRHGVDDLKV